MKLTKEALNRILSDRFKNESFYKLNHLPKPYQLKDLEKGAKRVVDAIKNGERITLIGDYDVDGVVSTAIVALFFEELNYPLEVIIPNRFSDGYGVSPRILERVNSDVVITVDNGISAVEAGKIAKAKGIDLIITDHHTPPEVLPEAYAIINPKLESCNFPFKEICGALVAWYFIAGIKIELKLNIDLKKYFDILSMAIIADVMPLIELNRVLVKSGLETINSSKRESIIAIKKYLNKYEFNSEDIAFQIAPRINSAGRLEDASIALNFLMAKSEDEAHRYFKILDDLNSERKLLEQELTNLAIVEVRESDKVIVVYGENWHEGVIGIIASRLVDKFLKPAIVFSINGEKAKGSARSFGDINILELIETQRDLLLGFGGHKGAAGLALKVENLEAFRDGINSKVSSSEIEALEDDSILGDLNLSEVDLDLLEILERFEPYGHFNPKPKFTSNLTISNAKAIGKNSEHLKLTLFDEDSKTYHNAVAFRCQESFEVNERVCVNYTLSKNDFNNRVSVQLIIDKFQL